MKIESKDIDIESLLTGSTFNIPRFQRPYSWDDENVNEFWSDLISNKGNDYFIGSMVVFKKQKQQFGVVDGQQRLTTITILLCVLRDHFLSLGCKDYAEGVHQLVERKNRSNQFEYVLKTETSFPYFQEHIQKFDEGPDAEVNIRQEEKNLESAHNRFKNLVEKTLEAIEEDPSVPLSNKKKLKIEKLLELRDSLLNLNLIFVVLDDEDDAYVIFETLNTRGKDLALTDLAKNHFSKQLKAKGEVDHAGLKWKSMLATIHNSSADISTDNFLYHFWASRHEATPLKKLFPKLRTHVTKSRAREYLDNLVADADIYRAIHENGYSWSKNETEVARSLAALQMFKLAQPTPATLSLVRAYRHKKIRYAKLRDALTAVEKFHFIFTAVTSSRSSGGISAMYSSFARKLFEANDRQSSAEEIKELVNKLKTRVPSFDEFVVAFREITYTNSNSKQKNLVRYILRKFSEHHSYRHSVDFDDLTIEHLHPQAESNDEWTDKIVGCLGNLVLLDQKTNGSLGTKAFTEKKALLEASNCSIPEFVQCKTSWTPDDVIENTDAMASTAYTSIWSI